jgi:hypothetical protein
MLPQALSDYVFRHHEKPGEIVLTPHAALALAASRRLTSAFDGVPLRCDIIDGTDAVPLGTGTRLGLFVRDNGVQQAVVAVELR